MYCLATTEAVLRFACISYIGGLPKVTWLDRLDMNQVSFFGTKAQASQTARAIGLTSWRIVKA
jgi:hypothetical protein